MLPTASSLIDSPASRINSFTYLQAAAICVWHDATSKVAVSAQQDKGACVRAFMSLGVKTMRVTTGLGWSENAASFRSCSTTTEPDTASLLGYKDASMRRQHSSRVPIHVLHTLGGLMLGCVALLRMFRLATSGVLVLCSRAVCVAKIAFAVSAIVPFCPAVLPSPKPFCPTHWAREVS